MELKWSNQTKLESIKWKKGIFNLSLSQFNLNYRKSLPEWHTYL